MKIKYLIAGTLLTLSLAGVSAVNDKSQNNKPETMETLIIDSYDYAKAWQEVEKLDADRLPRKAFAKVKEIRENALKEKNFQQASRAFIYAIDYTQQLEEDADKWQEELRLLRATALDAPDAPRAFLNLILAKYYQAFKDGNRFKNSNRTDVEDDQNEDINTWSPDRLDREMSACYRAAVANPAATQATPLEAWNSAIVTYSGDRPGNLTCTNLYDFIAWATIDNYCDARFGSNGDFSNRAIELVSDADTFVNYHPNNADTWSAENLRNEIYRELLRSHKADKTPAAYVFTDLYRLSYYKGKNVNEDAPTAYLKALENLKKRHSNDPELAPAIAYHIADEYRNQSRLKEAHDLAAETFKKFPKSTTGYSEMCNSLAKTLEIKRLSLKSEEYVPVNAPFALRAEYTNLADLYLHIYKVADLQAYNRHPYDRTDYIKKSLEEVRQQQVTLIDNHDYRAMNSEFIIEGLPAGQYIILGSNDQDFQPKKSDVISYMLVNITNIQVVTQQELNGRRRLYILDRTSGQPVKGAKITAYSDKKAVWNGTADDKGEASIDLKSLSRHWNLELQITDNDGNETTFSEYSSYYDPNNKQTAPSAYIFTDRKIYRPGQTIYYKVILYKGNGSEANVTPNQKTTIELLDINRKSIAKQELTTNEFGSVHGHFDIPTGLANGMFTIRESTTRNCLSVNVEEYKRPTFEVSLDAPNGEVKIGDRVSVNGSAATYAGIKIQGAKVRYEVTRVPEWRGWWSWNFDYRETPIENGETTTDDDGCFTINFTAKPDVNAKNSDYLVYNYRVVANVTDINGETRTATRTTSAGYRSMFITSDLPSDFNIIEKTNLDSATVYCESVNGSEITADVTVKISKLANFDKPRHPKQWQSCDNPLPSLTREIWDSKIPNTAFSKADNNLDSLPVEKLIKTIDLHCANGEGNIDLSILKKEGSGHYLVEIESKDREGRKVEYQRRFTLFSHKDNILKINKVFYSTTDKSSYEPGEMATLYIGSALTDVPVHYQVKMDDKILSSGVKTLNKSVEKIQVPVTEGNRGGMTVMMFYVRNNHYESHTEYINVPYTNKRLDVKFETFRDRLYPGDTEKWKIRITDYKQKPIRAEFAATLYDASLNALAANSWYLNVFRGNSSNYWFSQKIGGTTGTAEFSGENNKPVHADVSLSHPQINWYGHTPRFGRYYRDDMIMYSNARVLSKSADARGVMPEVMMMMKTDDVAVEEAADMEADDEAVNTAATADSGAGETEDFSNAEIRTNFAETAFFKPDIVTDYNGDLFVEFTVPQSITRWKMLGLAHTKDMAVGTVTNELITNKDFSIIPNLPRFLRCGDSIEIPVKISNMGDNDVVRGQIKMEVLDVATMRPIKDFKIWEPLQAFEVFKGKTEATHFAVEVPQYEHPIVIRITGVSGPHSDGEQHIIPVLTDKTLVTEALTLSVRGNQSKTFEFKNWTDNPSTTAIDHSLTLEYSSNPAWYAVSSLPWLSQNPFDCYEQTFSKLFANSVSKLILDNNPDIRTILDKWLADNSQALTSPLLKNQELKTVLIEETPWLIDGDTETDRMHTLSELLDAQRIAAENEKFIKKLADGQYSSGGWPWFAGMLESKWVTQHIVGGFGKLRHIGVDIKKDPRIEQMIDRAIGFIDDEAEKYFNKYIKKDKLAPDYFGYQYLYTRSFFPEYKLGGAKEAYDYYLKYAKENWTKFSLYYQAVLCTVFKRTGDETVAKRIIASLQDRAVRSDEFGMYFNDNVNGTFWHERNIETQSMVVEAFQEMGLKDEVEELKIWLIKNRQSNRWATTTATTEACYAMFLCGNKIKADEPLCKIIVGGKKIDTHNAEAGTGYIKQAWQGHEMDKSMARITVENPNDHISYGAVYRQYFEDLDKVRPADNKLQIDKQMYLTAKGPDGKDVLKEITPNMVIRPGDKVTVRFIIRTDRDLDYVHLKDMRAAGFEPLNVLSRTKHQDNLWYYESTKDASENFFIEHINKGTYVFEYPLIAVHVGDFSNGIATIQCMYAPEFTAHSAGMRFKIGE